MKRNRIIVVDGRVFSTEAHDRGMGRYVKFIIRMIASENVDVTLIMYKNSKLNKNDKLYSFIKNTDTIGIAPENHDDNDVHKSSYEIENILRKQKAFAYIDATPFIPPMRLDITICPVISIAYDLIPLRYPSEYLPDVHPISKQYYRNGLRRLSKANYIISISEFTKDLIFEYLGISKNQVDVIYPCLDKEYIQYELGENVKTKDIFSIIGHHHSKNPLFALKLFNSILKVDKLRYSLCVPTSGQLFSLMSQFPDETNQLKFNHSISEIEKIANQRDAKTVFHLSKEEGFGIPLLEAIFLGSRVVCSDIKVNREITAPLKENEGDIVLFLPVNSEIQDLSSIIKFINTEESSNTIRSFEDLRSFYLNHWSKEAPKIITQVIDKAAQNFMEFHNQIISKMACNMPGEFCGVADYAGSIPLGTDKNIIMYTSDVNINKLNSCANIRIKSHLNFAQDLDEKIPTIFHLAISNKLWFGVELLKNHGLPHDVVIIHDHTYLYGIYHLYFNYKNITQFIDRFFVGDDQPLKSEISKSHYMNYFEFEQSIVGYNHAWLKERGVKCVSHLTPEAEKSKKLLSKNELVIKKSYVDIGIHDRGSISGIKIARLWRRRRKISSNDLVIGIFGSITDNKYIDKIAEAVSNACHYHRISSKISNILFLVCGVIHDQNILQAIQTSFSNLAILDCLYFENPEEEDVFDALMIASDIVVACRRQDRGQLSHIIPRALSLGRPLLTNRGSGYLMVQDKCVIDDNNFIEDLKNKILNFYSNRSSLNFISTYNRKLFENKYNIQRMFRNILDV